MNGEDFKLHLGTALMYEYEVITNGPKFSAGRSSSYLSATAKFTTVVGLTTVLYYQPRLFDASDNRVALEAGLLLNFAKRFTFESRLSSCCGTPVSQSAFLSAPTLGTTVSDSASSGPCGFQKHGRSCMDVLS